MWWRLGTILMLVQCLNHSNLTFNALVFRCKLSGKTMTVWILMLELPTILVIQNQTLRNMNFVVTLIENQSAKEPHEMPLLTITKARKTQSHSATSFLLLAFAHSWQLELWFANTKTSFSRTKQQPQQEDLNIVWSDDVASWAKIGCNLCVLITSCMDSPPLLNKSFASSQAPQVENEKKQKWMSF